MKNQLISIFIFIPILALVIISGCITEDAYDFSEQVELKQFTSQTELTNFLKDKTDQGGYGGLTFNVASVGATRQMTTGADVSTVAESTTGAQSAEKAADYSETNIQVAGVDEADFVKNDGKYIYAVSGEKIVIVDAYPADSAEVVSELDVEGVPQELFINNDKLVVFGYAHDIIEGDSEDKGDIEETTAEELVVGHPYRRYTTYTFTRIYDISDRSNPTLEDEIKADGSYFDSRMIDDYVYVVVNQPVYYADPVPLPRIDEQKIAAAEIYYFDIPDYSYRYVTIMALDLNDNSHEEEVYLMGSAQQMFVSTDNIYVVYQKRIPYNVQQEMILKEIVIPIMPADVKAKISVAQALPDEQKWSQINKIMMEYINGLDSEEREAITKQATEQSVKVMNRIYKLTERTVIHRISINKKNIEYKANGEVPGRVLNQFSMDQHEDHFRIATTTGRVTRSGAQTTGNHVYVLDMNLDVVGKLEDLAPGESIYSVRFMGDRGYVVTFVKIDPLFVIDLSDPANPSVLGKLKIPGYSDYLHPYDENHIIGLGKEAIAAEQGGFSWYQGVKLALFDVSDVTSPKEISKVEIGDRGTDSYALHDHHAFLFSKDRNLLVIPILLAEIDESKYPGGVSDNTHGDYVWQGAYVFNLDTTNGFVEKGRITHIEDETFAKSGYYYSGGGYSVQRSLYMDDVLYTISDAMIKMNSLDDLTELNSVELPYEWPDYGYPRPI